MQGLETRYDDVDLVIVRENTEDLYAGIEHMVGRDAAESIKIITRAASERIARYAFDYAVANGRRKVTAVHKANIMKLSDGLFLESCRTVAAEYDGRVEFEDRIVDNMCMQLVQKPDLYDVLVLPNLYGDIVSDLAAGLVGGLGVAPGANIGTEAAVFEPVHGSAPKYAGLNKANPTALILSGALMLRHLGYPDAADRVETAAPRRHRRGPDRRPTTSAARPARASSPTPSSSGSARRDARRRRRPGRRRPPATAVGTAPMTGLPARSARAPAAQAAGTAPPGSGATRRRDRWWLAPVVQGTLFTVCATYLFVSGILLDAALRDAVRGRRLPLAAVLAADRARLAADLDQPRPVHPVDPARLPGDLLLLPQGLLPLLLRRPARLRGRRADGPPPLRARDGVPVHPPEPPPLLPVPRLHPAVLPVDRRGPSLRARAAASRIGLGVAILFVNAAPADRLLAVVPLAAPPRRRPARLLLVHPPRAGPPRRSGSGLTSLNRHHMAWAWASLITVTLADVYVRLVALGRIADPAIHF